VNPVLVRELRGRMRGRRAFLALGLFVLLHSLFFLWFFTFELAPAFGRVGTGSGRLAVVGRELFTAFIGVLAALVGLFTPAFTATAISRERDRGTLDFLKLTLLTPMQIVWGKLLGGFLYIALLVVTSLPILGVVLLVGGVDVHEIGLAYLGLAFEALLVGAFCVALSTQSQSGSFGSALSYIVPMFALWVIVPLLVKVLPSVEPWYGWPVPLLVPFVPVLALAIVAMLAHAALQLTNQAYDRSMQGRLSLGALHLVVTVTMLGFAYGSSKLTRVDRCEDLVALWYGLNGLFCLAAVGLLCVTESSHVELQRPPSWSDVAGPELLRNRLGSGPWFIAGLTVLGMVLFGLFLYVQAPSCPVAEVLPMLFVLGLSQAAAVLAWGHVLVALSYGMQSMYDGPFHPSVRVLAVAALVGLVLVMPLVGLWYIEEGFQSGTVPTLFVVTAMANSPFTPLVAASVGNPGRPVRELVGDIERLTGTTPLGIHLALQGLVFVAAMLVVRSLRPRVVRSVLGEGVPC